MAWALLPVDPVASFIQHASYFVAGSHIEEGRLFFVADAQEGFAAAWVERAAGRDRVRVGHGAANGGQAAVDAHSRFTTQAWNRAEQRLGIGVSGVIEDRVDIG